jgi:hypothetical protein
MLAFEYYGYNPNCSSKVLLKLLEMDCRPLSINHEAGSTALMLAFEYYGFNYNYDPKVFTKLLSLNCGASISDRYKTTASMLAFRYFGSLPNHDPKILLKLLDHDININCEDNNNESVFNYAFKYYVKNPNFDPKVFLKLIFYRKLGVNRNFLIRQIDNNTKDQIIKNKILGEYNYKVRGTIISKRIKNRRAMGKHDSLNIF